MDPMKYTMEQLANALIDQTMGEVEFTSDQYVFDEPEGTPNPNTFALAQELYNSLKGVQPDTERAREIASYFSEEIEQYSLYPWSHKLLDAIEYVVWEKYKDDPKPITKIVVDEMNSQAATNWYNNNRKYR